jgi:hypothetical protein
LLFGAGGADVFGAVGVTLFGAETGGVYVVLFGAEAVTVLVGAEAGGLVAYHSLRNCKAMVSYEMGQTTSVTATYR